MRVPAHLPRRTGASVAALLAVVAVTAGCAAGGSSRTSTAPSDQASVVADGNVLDQKVPAVAATTRLVDQSGRALTLRGLRGRIVVLAPLLTMCQETCPMTSENLHRAAQAVRRSGAPGGVVFLEVSVDPQRDTVARLHAYARLYGAEPGWELATGRPAEVLAFWKALGVVTEKVPTHEPVRDWMTGKLVRHPYDVHHQDVVVVVDPAGRLRWITVGHPDARGSRLPRTMRQFLNDEGRLNYAHPTAHGAGTWTAEDVEQAVAYVRRLGSAGS